MTIALDPFQLVRGINLVAPLPQEWAENVLNIGATSFFSFTMDICALDSTCGTYLWTGYETILQWRLKAEVKFCEQQTYAIRQPSSGVELEIGHVAPLNALNIDCKSLPACEATDRCNLKITDSTRVFASSLGSAFNGWSVPGQYHLYSLAVYTVDDPGFNPSSPAFGDDVRLGVFTLDIETITAGTSGRIAVKITDHEFLAGERLRVDGTVNYDGVWTVATPITADSFDLIVSYVGDESVGTVTPSYGN